MKARLVKEAVEFRRGEKTSSALDIGRDRKEAVKRREAAYAELERALEGEGIGNGFWTFKAENLWQVSSIIFSDFVKRHMDKADIEYIKPEEFTLPQRPYYAEVPERMRERMVIVQGEDGQKYLMNCEGYKYPRYLINLDEGKTS